MVFCMGGVSYTELKEMDLAEFAPLADRVEQGAQQKRVKKGGVTCG